MKTFLEYVNEAKQPGVYAAYHIAPETKASLAKFVKDLGIKNPSDPASLHITTVHSTKPIQYEPSKDVLAVKPVGYALFGHPDKVLVLKVEHPSLHERFKVAKDAGATWDYPSYQPHITLAVDVDPDLDTTKLPLPDFILRTGPEYTEPLSD